MVFNIEAKKMVCDYTYKACVRKGMCCRHIAYHLKFNELPTCVFPATVEKTYDRSVARFATLVNQGTLASR